MSNGKHSKKRIRILVKAFPQHSNKYEETVCCAGVDVESNEFLRLYPIRYRHLQKEQQFNRYDLVEITATKATDDVRPESYRVDEPSIQILKRGSQLSNPSKVQLWKPFIASSLTALLEESKQTKRSLGIIKPDVDSLKFKYQLASQSDQDDQELANVVYKQQASFLEDPLKPLEKPKYSFRYEYTSDGHAHKHQILDWEVQATFINYRRQYSSEAEALQMMTNEYQENIPNHNLHFIMGNMAKRQYVFILIGMLRTRLSPDELDKQRELF